MRVRSSGQQYPNVVNKVNISIAIANHFNANGTLVTICLTLVFFPQIEETDETGDRSDRRDAR